MPMPNSKSMRPAPEAFARAAAYLGCDVAAIRAVAQVEAGLQGAFISTSQDVVRPTILFEPHIFDRLTNGRFRAAKAPFLSGPSAVLSRERWAPGTYGPFSAQYARFNAAAQLNRQAAIKATSWGLFQILGENYKRCGFEGPEDFVEAMYRDVERGFGVLDPMLNVFISGFKLPVLMTLQNLGGQYGGFSAQGVSPLPLFALTAAIIYGIWLGRWNFGVRREAPLL